MTQVPDSCWVTIQVECLLPCSAWASTGQPASPTPLLLSVLPPVCIPCPTGFCVEFETDPQTSSGTVVQQLSHVRFLATPWTAACQASLSSTISWSLLKVMNFKSVIPFSHLILSCPLLLLPLIFLRIRIFSSESVLRIRWPNIGGLASALVLPRDIKGSLL